MTSSMRTRLNKIKEVAGARDDEYCARAWLRDVFFNVMRDALIDDKSCVTIGDYGRTSIRDKEIKLLKEMGYNVSQHTHYENGVSATTTTISWNE